MSFSYLSRCDVSGSAAAPSLPASQLVRGIYLKPHNLQPHYEVVTALYGSGALQGRTQASWGTRLGWVREDVNFRGFQLSVPWGLYETGASGGDFSNLDKLETVIDELYNSTPHRKYVILMPFIFREFRNSDVTALSVDNQMRYLLPEDMRTHQGVLTTLEILNSQGITPIATSGTPSNSVGANGQWAHDSATNMFYGPKAGGIWPAGAVDPMRQNLWDYAYGYQKSQNSNFGFDLKCYLPYVRTRMNRFIQAVADKFNSHPGVIFISSTESIVTGPMYLGNRAGGVVSEGYAATTAMTSATNNVRWAGLQGKTAIMQAGRVKFPNKAVAQDVNVPLNGYNYVAEWFAQLEANKFGTTTSDLGWWEPDLNDLTPPTVGCLPLMAQYSPVAPTMLQMQKDFMDSYIHGAPVISSTAQYTKRYEDIWARVNSGTLTGGPSNDINIFGVNAHMVLVQLESEHGYWVGGGTFSTQQTATTFTNITVPSLKDWFKAKFAAEGITDGSAGLNPANPQYIGLND